MLVQWDHSSSLAFFSEFSLCFYNGTQFPVRSYTERGTHRDKFCNEDEMRDCPPPLLSYRQGVLVRQSEVVPGVSLGSWRTCGRPMYHSRPQHPPPPKKRPQNRCPRNGIGQESVRGSPPTGSALHLLNEFPSQPQFH